MSLVDIAKKFKTDKQYPTHSYIEKYYNDTFKLYKDKRGLNILEIGVNEGQSLELWNAYFEDANIVGVDKNLGNYTPSSKNITVIQGKSGRVETYKNLNSFDIIIDDGSHKVHDQTESFNILFPRLNLGGIYVIEDVKDIDTSKNIFLSLNPNTKIFDYRSNLNRSDDVIVEIKK